MTLRRFAMFSILALPLYGQTSIPMSTYIEPGRDGLPHSGVLVGGNPWLAGPFPVTIEAVVVPVVIVIAGTTVTKFDPSSANACDGGFSAVTRFANSPLVVPTDLTFNGVYVGKHQYVDGFMRAEFWNLIHGNANYSNPIHWSFAS